MSDQTLASQKAIFRDAHFYCDIYPLMKINWLFILFIKLEKLTSMDKHYGQIGLMNCNEKGFCVYLLRSNVISRR